MARSIWVKYGIGDRVRHFTGVRGKVTAIFHRGGKNAYEMSFLRDGSEPTSCICEECEFDDLPDGEAMLGFKK
jgi:hypothetical protein